MSIYKIIGIGLILSGVGMFVVGIHFFTYRGEVKPFISRVGEFEFTMWLPVIIGGFIFLLFKPKQ